MRYRHTQVLIEVIKQCLIREKSKRFKDGMALKKVFYAVGKEDRQRIRHNRFKASWHILLEKNLIENFVLGQIQLGVSVFRIEAFLGVPEVYQLGVMIDRERLEEVLGKLSGLS